MKLNLANSETTYCEFVFYVPVFRRFPFNPTYTETYKEQFKIQFWLEKRRHSRSAQVLTTQVEGTGEWQ